jgi:D-arabinose 1-dehydrogenase-like Zn-dependent alcohol dehydrogenase
MGTTDEFKAMLDFINEHQIVPVIDEAFPLSEADKAVHKMDKSTQFGKIVLKVS